ncbi:MULTISPECIES: SAM-dependent methyltransferase [Thermomonospora]|uniref:O-methyltransferase involved in polyketide biosynthesis n=1 Tax=Thermomonospora cellulosilytica TaxID=1411118 RepID=A0A7W3MVI1_9ACTN|nr:MULTISPECIES: SAM-dependent methyltransferase [Thermomonospora]MBA9002643.1 O-methyltransferase involved in polyketide biosynthesis [Thermomonospora cellulosilytica]
MTQEPPDIDTSVSHVARIWNYWLGGKDNYEVDRQVGDQILQMLPDVARLARASRMFLNRAVWHLAAEAGVRQFLDVGTGLPTVDNTHQVAQRAAPESRIVYVDHDPLVLAHARALLTSTPEGRTDYINADLREPDKILAGARRTLDFDRPIALMLMGVMEFITDDDEAYSIVRRLLEELPSGSYLAMYDGTNVVHREASDQIVEVWNSSGNAPLVLRSPEQIARFFDGLEIIEPGVVSVTRWRPEIPPGGEPEEVDAFGAVGRKP